MVQIFKLIGWHVTQFWLRGLFVYVASTKVSSVFIDLLLIKREVWCMERESRRSCSGKASKRRQLQLANQAAREKIENAYYAA